MIRTLLVDDIALFRDGVSQILGTAADIEVVGQAGDGEQGLVLAKKLKPDVALVDLKMPRRDGVELTRSIRREVPSCHVLVLTTFEDDQRIFEALRAGALGYLLKDTRGEQLIEAIRTASTGASVLTPAVATRVVRELVRLQPLPHAGGPSLSPREREILCIVGRGASNKDIAATLRIAEGTVKNHLTNILEKLGVSDRTQAALRARELGLLEP